MGSYVDGIYLPAHNETGYDDEVDANFRRLGEMGVNVKAEPFGALGDGSDDSAAIQAAIDTGKHLFFPATTSYYGIGTPLTDIPLGRHWFGGGQSINPDSGTSFAARLRCVGGNTKIIQLNGDGLDHNTFENLMFADSVGGATATETAFDLNGEHIISSRWLNCHFWGLKWAFDANTANSWYLSNWVSNSTFHDAPIRLANVTGYFNNNHWNMTTFYDNNKNVPFVDLGPGIGNEGNHFTQFYCEHADRSFIRSNSPTGLTVRDGYLEAINEDNQTYTANDGRTQPLPAVDIIGSNGAGIVLEGWFVSGPDLGWTLFGSTSVTGYHKELTWSAIDCNPLANFTAGGTVWDASNFRAVRGGGFYSQMTFVKLGGQPSGFSGHILPVHDALLQDTWNMAAHTGDGGQLIIPNPKNATEGRRVTYIFDSQVEGVFPVTWGNQYKFVGGAAPSQPPSLGHSQQITFEYCGLDASTGAYSSTGGKWVEVSRSSGEVY